MGKFITQMGNLISSTEQDKSISNNKQGEGTRGVHYVPQVRIKGVEAYHKYGLQGWFKSRESHEMFH